MNFKNVVKFKQKKLKSLNNRSNQSHAKYNFIDRYFFLILMVSIVFSGYFIDKQNDKLISTYFIFAVYIAFVSIHEYGHSILAYYGGDKTVKEKKYLTLNIFRYSDLFSTFFLPIISLLNNGVGFCGACVYITTDYLKSNIWKSVVAAGGIILNLFCILFTILFYELIKNLQLSRLLLDSVSFLIVLEIGVTTLNILPYPSLDGYFILEPYLNKKIKYFCSNYMKYFQWGFYLLFLIPNTIFEKIWYFSFFLASIFGVNYVNLHDVIVQPKVDHLTAIALTSVLSAYLMRRKLLK